MISVLVSATDNDVEKVEEHYYVLQKRLLMLLYQMADAMQLFRMFWVESLWQQNLFQNCEIFNKDCAKGKLFLNHQDLKSWRSLFECVLLF